MKKILLVLLIFTTVSTSAYAYKVYSYDSNGNRVYQTVESTAGANPSSISLG